MKLSILNQIITFYTYYFILNIICICLYNIYCLTESITAFSLFNEVITNLFLTYSQKLYTLVPLQVASLKQKELEASQTFFQCNVNCSRIVETFSMALNTAQADENKRERFPQGGVVAGRERILLCNNAIGFRLPFFLNP